MIIEGFKNTVKGRDQLKIIVIQITNPAISGAQPTSLYRTTEVKAVTELSETARTATINHGERKRD